MFVVLVGCNPDLTSDWAELGDDKMKLGSVDWAEFGVDKMINPAMVLADFLTLGAQEGPGRAPA